MTASDTLPGLRALCATIETTYHMRMRGRCNSDRQMEGGFLLTLMEIVTGVDEKEDALSDVLCQLMHRASDPDDPLDFERALEGARRNFERETTDDI